MMRLVFAAVLALAVAGEAGAVRTVEAVEGAYELDLANLVLPTSASGRLSLHVCATCERVDLRVNATTQYTFDGGKPLSLTDFQRTVTRLRQQPGAKASSFVFYNVATKRVTRVVVRSVQ